MRYALGVTMKDYVSSHLGFSDRDVRLLLDGEATRDNILRAIADEGLMFERLGTRVKATLVSRTDDVRLLYYERGRRLSRQHPPRDRGMAN